MRIQRGAITERLIRHFGIRDRGPARDIVPNLQPVVIAEDLTREAWFAATTDRPCGGVMFSLTPAAGQFEAAQLFNPVGSNMLLLVEQVTLAPGVSNMAYSIAIVLTALTNLDGTSGFRDTIQDPAYLQRPVGQLRNESLLAAQTAGIKLGGGRALVDDTVIYPIRVTLAPGTGLNIGSGTANAAMTPAFQWRERTRLA